MEKSLPKKFKELEIPSGSKFKEYIGADRLEKESIAKKKSLRDYVGRLLNRCKRFGIELEGVSYSEQERYNFNEELLYDWVKSQVDAETLDSITKKVIDIEKLHQLYAEGKINTELIDENVYSVTKYFTIKIDHKKVNKWKK